MATQTAVRYAVYVSDDSGWGQDCPDYCGVFFGTTLPAGGKYVSHRDGSPFGGHVEFDTRDAAADYLDDLSGSGDWTVKAPNDTRHGNIERPEYAVAEITD